MLKFKRKRDCEEMKLLKKKYKRLKKQLTRNRKYSSSSTSDNESEYGDDEAIDDDNQTRLVYSDDNPDITDCLHLQLYREPKDRYKKGQTKASLSLQHFLGFESGFTLDKESNTIAIICQDVSVVLALETRERLIAWQVKLSHQLGTSKDFLVMISGGNKKLPAGPARLHLQGQKFALTAGLPPRLLGLWEIPHLRRYGVVESRFCFEGGSYCGKGEGLHVLITDQAQQITDAFDIATYGSSNQYTISRKSETLRGNNNMRPDTRLSDNSYDQSLPDTASALYEDNYFGEDCGTTSPLWPSDERRGFSDGKSLWEGANHITLERCTNCQTKLGSSARSSTVALGPFNPAWTMDPAPENNPAYQMQQISFPSDIDSPPQRPPKPQNFEQCKPPALLPTKHPKNDNNLCINNSKVGPYENYDVPKPISFDKHKDEHYDTPKRLKNNLADELFQVSNEAPPGSLVLTKTCGCLLKFGSKKKATIIECEENIQPVECPCQKVTNWANNLISLPYCKRKPDNIRTEILQEDSLKAIYATVDVSRKTSRKNESETNIVNNKLNFGNNDSTDINYENIEPKDTSTQHYSNYVNLDFAMSLEYYENAKDLLKKAGLTQTELDALSASVTKVTNTLPKRQKLCSDCKKCQSDQFTRKNKSDDYLLMQPADDSSRERCQTLIMNPGYTPMCPNPKWSHSLRHPLQKSHSETDKFSSSPVLNQNNFCSPTIESLNIIQNQIVKIRCSSVESTSMNENADSTEQSQDTSCSLETLRNLNFNNSDISNVLPSDNHVEREKTTELPPLRKIINMHSKRPSSVPSKTGCNRDSSSSNDSGVSSCSMKQVCTEFQEYESAQHFPKQLVLQRNFQEDIMNSAHPPLPRKSKSSDPIKDLPISIHCTESNKSSSAEAEVPVLPTKHFRNVADTRSTSSGTSDMSDYFETLSVSSSQSSSDALSNMRISRQPTNTLRPRSGKEYHNLDPTITSMYKTGKDLSNYTNIP